MDSQVNAATYHLPSVLNSASDNKPTLSSCNNKRFRKSSLKNNKTMTTAIVKKLSSAGSRKNTNAPMNATTTVDENADSAPSELLVKRRYKWQVGDRVDVKSLESKIWHLSRIIAINRRERKLKIHYHNLNSKYDEWLSLRSTRIRPLGCTGTTTVANSTSNSNTQSSQSALPDDNYKVICNSTKRITNSKKKCSKMKQTNKSSCDSTIGSDGDRIVYTDNETPTLANSSTISDVEVVSADAHTNGLAMSDSDKNSSSFSTANSGTANICSHNSTLGSQIDTSLEESNGDSNNGTNSSRAYHTRKISRRYSLETIVVDESFNKSGVLNYHGGYIRTVGSNGKSKSAATSAQKSSRSQRPVVQPIATNTVVKRQSKSCKPPSKKPTKRLLVSSGSKSRYKKLKRLPIDLAQQDIVHSSNMISIQLASPGADTSTNITTSSSSVVDNKECSLDRKEWPTLSNGISKESRDILCVNEQNRVLENNVATSRHNNQKDNESPAEAHDANNMPTLFGEGAVQCICSSREDDGIMLQCELCFYWQHGHCVGFTSHNQIPSKYVCSLCTKPYFQQCSFPINYLTLLTTGYLGDTKLNQSCKISSNMAEILVNTFKFKDYVSKLKRHIIGTNSNSNAFAVDMNLHLDELFNIYNRLKIKSDSLFIIQPSSAPTDSSTCVNNEKS